MAPNVIASRDVIVHDPNLDIDRKLFAGQPVPPDLVKVYEEAVGKPAAEEQHDRKTAGGIEDAIESGQDTESPKRSGRGRSNG